MYRPLTEPIPVDGVVVGAEESFDIFMLAAVVGLRYGIADGWEIALEMPFVRKDLKPEGGEEGGDDHEEEPAGHGDETLSGPGDFRLLLKRHLRLDNGMSISLRGGVSLPTGDTRPVDRLSFLDADEAAEYGIEREAVPELQNGTGAWFPILGVDIGGSMTDTLAFYASATADLHFQENDSGWRRATSLSGEMGMSWKPVGSDYSARCAINYFTAGGDYFAGEDVVTDYGPLAGEIPDLRNGRSELSLRPGGSWVIEERFMIHADLAFPIWSRLQSGARAQENVLRERAGVFLGFSWRP
jgi:hypothetical protein